MEGILFALIPMISWGSIGFISNKIGGNPSQQTFGMTIGALFFAVCSWILIRPHLTTQLWIVGSLGGALWAIGQNGQFKAMKFLGVSIANPLSSGAQLVLGSIIGALVFNEWKTSFHFTLGISAVVLLLFGFYFSSKTESSSSSHQSLNYSKGFIALTYSTIGYLSYTILFNNIMHFEAFSVLFPMAIGMFITSILFMKGNVKLEGVVVKNSLVGILWGVGNIFMLLAAAKVGIAIAFSFSQLGIIISILGSIFFLNEVKTKKEIKWLIIGVILFIIGAILLGIIKSN